MSLQRIDRALRQHGLEPIPTVGDVYDPELMEAVEVVAGSGLAAGEVVQEVRRGYRWNGRVFRYAQVRVARG
jgi:molecular chaperone GrpE